LAQSELLDVTQGAGAHPGERHRAQDRLDYVNTPPSVAAIKAVLKAMEMAPRDLLRRRGTPYDELRLGDETLSDAALIEAMHAHPILIERPVVQAPKGTRLCRPAERVQDIL
jgi:arsenate reductase